MIHRKLGTGASCRNQVLCLGFANSSVRPLISSVGGRVCGSKGNAPTWLTALHDASEPPQALVSSLGRFPQKGPRYPRWRQRQLRCTAGLGRGLSSGHTPTTSESGNPAPPAAQKALDRRRRFTLIRLVTSFPIPHAHWGVRARRRLGIMQGCGGTRSGPLEEPVNCTPRDGRGTEAVNHFSRLPAG